jgi:predicted component of type VI protein secretion system
MQTSGKNSPIKREGDETTADLNTGKFQDFLTLKIHKALNELDDLMEQKEGIKALKGRIFDIQLVSS